MGQNNEEPGRCSAGGILPEGEGEHKVGAEDRAQELLNAPLGAVIQFMLERASISTTHFTDNEGNPAIMVLMDCPNRIPQLEAILEKWAMEDAQQAEAEKAVAGMMRTDN